MQDDNTYNQNFDDAEEIDIGFDDDFVSEVDSDEENPEIYDDAVEEEDDDGLSDFDLPEEEEQSPLEV